MKPLAGRVILVTRSREQAGDLREALEKLGGRVVEAPVIAFEDPENWGPADSAIGRLDRFDLVIFTSANAVERFLRRMETLAVPRDRLRGALVAIGSATAARLESNGLPAAAVASDSRAEGVLDVIRSRWPLEGLSILIPRAVVARDFLPDRLGEAGAVVTVAPVYRTVSVPLTREAATLLREGSIDAVTFTSSSTVTHLLRMVGGAAALSGVAVAVIGPVTAETARGAGLIPQVVAPSASVNALASGLADYFEKR